MSARIFLTVFWIIIHASVGSSQVVKTWNIDSFQVNLGRYEQVQETPVIFPIDRSSARSFYSLFEIRKQEHVVYPGSNKFYWKNGQWIKQEIIHEQPVPRD